MADVIKSFWKSHKSATEPLCDEERHNCCQQCQDKHIVVSCCSYIVVKICRVGKSTPYLLTYQQCSEQHFRGLQKNTNISSFLRFDKMVDNNADGNDDGDDDDDSE